MSNNSHHLIGTILGKCRIEQRIGQGGHAVVFLATQESLHRHVALKVLQPQGTMSSNDDFLARFQREAGVIAKFNHVNIMPIYDYGEQDGLAYLIMPYCTGGSLQDLLARRGALSLRDTLTYMDQAASALDYAHQHRVIHRDIKPANFLLQSDGRLVLADFGIAHLMIESIAGSALTGMGLLLGTPEYMAPEMIRGKPVDLRADIYELGIVLYQMLSGSLPFQSHSPYATMVKHLTDPVPRLHPTHPTIPPAVDEVIQIATRKEPSQRFRSAGELAQALRAAATGHYPAPHTISSNGSTVTHGPDQPAGIGPLYAPTMLPYRVAAPRPYIAASPSDPTVVNPVIQPPSARVPAPPVARPRPVKPKPRPFALAFLFLIVIIFGGSLAFAVANGTFPYKTAPTPTVTATPTLTPGPVLAHNTVQQFYTYLNAGDYRAAYNMSTNSPTPAGYCQFAGVYQYTERNDITFTSTPYLDQGYYVVPITIHAHEIISSTTRDSIYQEQVYVEQQNGAWKIMGGHRIDHTLGTPTPISFSGQTPADQAQTLVKRYYDNLSQHDYPAAYNLLSPNIQSAQPFCDFVDRNAGTKQITITSMSAAAQPDGTINVDVTIQTTSEQGAGGTTQTQSHQIDTVEQGNTTLDIKNIAT